MAGFWSAGLGASAIPDSAMFQNAVLQWSAASGIDVSDGQTTDGWVDTIADANATDNGDPTYRADKSGFQAVEYDPNDGSNDTHSIPSGVLPLGDDLSFAATVYVPATEFNGIISYGNNARAEGFNLRLDDGGSVTLDVIQTVRATGGSYSTSQWITVGGVINSESTNYVYLDGSQVGSDITQDTANIQDTNRVIGARGYLNDLYLNGSIYDLVVCDGVESSTAFSDYHTDRLG